MQHVSENREILPLQAMLSLLDFRLPSRVLSFVWSSVFSLYFGKWFPILADFPLDGGIFRCTPAFTLLKGNYTQQHTAQSVWYCSLSHTLLRFHVHVHSLKVKLFLVACTQIRSEFRSTVSLGSVTSFQLSCQPAQACFPPHVSRVDNNMCFPTIQNSRGI